MSKREKHLWCQPFCEPLTVITAAFAGLQSVMDRGKCTPGVSCAELSVVSAATMSGTTAFTVHES